MAIAIAYIIPAWAENGTVVARSGNCPWFVVEGSVIGVCSIVEVLSGSLPGMGEQIEVGSGGRRIDDKPLACGVAIAKLRERCQ
jgi:hypothetical protein